MSRYPPAGWSRTTMHSSNGQSGSRPITSQSRPWTGQSRPATARPMTSASVRHEGSYVIALLEGRGVGREIGMAALDRDTGKVMVVQVSKRF